MAKAKTLTPAQITQPARIAALARWSQENPKAFAESGQQGLLERFRREVVEEDPDVVEPELSRRAEVKRQLHMERLSFKASRARQRKARAG